MNLLDGPPWTSCCADVAPVCASIFHSLDLTFAKSRPLVLFFTSFDSSRRHQCHRVYFLFKILLCVLLSSFFSFRFSFFDNFCSELYSPILGSGISPSRHKDLSIDNSASRYLLPEQIPLSSFTLAQWYCL